MCVSQNWPNFEKRTPFLQILSKLSDFFLVKDLTNILLFQFIATFWEHIFLARMRCLKNGWPLSAPPRAYFYHPQLLKKKFGKSWHQTAFTKKQLRSFDENWRNTSNICTRWAAAAPHPHTVLKVIISSGQTILWFESNHVLFPFSPKSKSFNNDVFWVRYVDVLSFGFI